MGHREPPHFSKFNMGQEEFSILLTGAPDAVFVRPDRSHLIADYKTAKHMGHSGMMPGLAYLHERGYKPVGWQ